MASTSSVSKQYPSLVERGAMVPEFAAENKADGVGGYKKAKKVKTLLSLPSRGNRRAVGSGTAMAVPVFEQVPTAHVQRIQII